MDRSSVLGVGLMSDEEITELQTRVMKLEGIVNSLITCIEETNQATADALQQPCGMIFPTAKLSRLKDESKEYLYKARIELNDNRM